MGINNEYVLIHKDDFAELLGLRQEKAAMLAKPSDNIFGEFSHNIISSFISHGVDK